MKRLLHKCILVWCALFTATFAVAAKPTNTDLSPEQLNAAREVIGRYIGVEVAKRIELEGMPFVDGRPQFAVKENGYHIEGSTPVAICRGFYSATKKSAAGMYTWVGNRFDPVRYFNPSSNVAQVSPYEHVQYFNAVTFGYSMAFWNERRWRKEIDWMALHGIDMPLALIASEAILERVLLEEGLTPEEVDAYFCGPAYQPWLRMGNLAGSPGNQSFAWRERQIALQHTVLDQMRTLGMKPIVPGFGGIVPKSIKRVHPEVTLYETSWSGYTAYFLSPEDPLFRKLGAKFVRAWEKEFGRCDYYLADSFNEMSLPWADEAAKLKGLAESGAQILGAIRDVNPNAVWVMQGWMLGYQRDLWTPERLKALVSKVPDDAMLILDMAEDYNMTVWKNGANWEHFEGFYGKTWAWSILPNMGGKTAWTGDLEFYANGHLDALISSKRGKLKVYGIAPEGIENNEVVYEIATDAAWRGTRADTVQLLRDYTAARYGKSELQMELFYRCMRNSVYGSLIDHPQFMWQLMPGGVEKARYVLNEDFYRGLKRFVSLAPKYRLNAFYDYDLRELVALGAAGRVDSLLMIEFNAFENGDLDQVQRARAEVRVLLSGIDRILREHPLHNLNRWIEFAHLAAGDDAQKEIDYERNACRLITMWGDNDNFNLCDYAARVWSGLIRSYYLPRIEEAWISLDADVFPKTATESFTRNWANADTHGFISTGNKMGTVLNQDAIRNFAAEVLAAGGDFPVYAPPRAIASWSAGQITTDWRAYEWTLDAKEFEGYTALRFRFLMGNSRLDIRNFELHFDNDAETTYVLNGSTGNVSFNNIVRLVLPDKAKLAKKVTLRAVLRCDGGSDSYGVIELIK